MAAATAESGSPRGIDPRSSPGVSCVMLRTCGVVGAAAFGVGGLAYMSRARAATTPVCDLMHPAHTTALKSGAEMRSFIESNVGAGRTVFVRWIASPK
jgi:hypothetical protein